MKAEKIEEKTEIELNAFTRNSLIVEKQRMNVLNQQLQSAKESFDRLIGVALSNNGIKINDNLTWQISDDYKKITIINEQK